RRFLKDRPIGPTSYLRLIITFGLSRTVSELLAHFSTSRRPRSNIKADSEIQYPTSHSRFVMTFGLSVTVYALLPFVCGPEMTSCRFLRQVVSQVKYKGEF